MDYAKTFFHLVPVVSYEIGLGCHLDQTFQSKIVQESLMGRLACMRNVNTTFIRFALLLSLLPL
jgi:hypothetical protein